MVVPMDVLRETEAAVAAFCLRAARPGEPRAMAAVGARLVAGEGTLGRRRRGCPARRPRVSWVRWRGGKHPQGGPGEDEDAPVRHNSHHPCLARQPQTGGQGDDQGSPDVATQTAKHSDIHPPSMWDSESSPAEHARAVEAACGERPARFSAFCVRKPPDAAMVNKYCMMLVERIVRYHPPTTWKRGAAELAGRAGELMMM
eukprot:jgi/Mesvir1/24059/Mv10786-RA.1